MSSATFQAVAVRVLALLAGCSAEFLVLDPADYREHFVEGWPGPYLNGSGSGEVNESTFEWATQNLPLFDSGDPDLVEAYYYRVKSYKSHIIPTGYADLRHVVSEFGPAVSWGGPYGTINAAAGHHLTEGRWIRDRSYMQELTRFWVGSQVGGGVSGGGGAATAPFEPAIGHFPNGSRGAVANCPYSSWILTGALRAAEVQGDLSLGVDLHGVGVTFADVLADMVQWWDTRSLQLRTDCIIANGGKTFGGDPACLDKPPQDGVPYCYIMADGWDAMEGSVSGPGCRPTIGAMMWSEALAISTIANLTHNTSVGETFQRRADYIQAWYLANLWNPTSQFFGVYKQGAEFSGMGGCTSATLQNKTDPNCCCVTDPHPTGHYANFSTCPPPSPPAPGNATACAAAAVAGTPPRHSSSWECGQAVSVRELLGLGPPYYFGITPRSASGTQYDGMWAQLFDPEGFWADWGPTTVERRATCFNKTQDMGECNWAGPSWPYETSRVLTGLANFLIDYPEGQAAAAAMTASNFSTLLKTYARSMTRGNATNGSVPWVGENIEPDKGFWVARSIMYRGGDGHIDPKHPWLPAADNPLVDPVNCSACEGTCYDRGWSSDGHKCTNMPKEKAEAIGPCDDGCSCVPPPTSYDYHTHSTISCCHATPSCDKKRLPTADKDRGKDYNHSTFIDIIIAGLVGLRAAFGTTLVLQPLADSSVGPFALDNLYYHGANLTLVWDPQGARWPKVGCAGLCVYVNGTRVANSATLTRLRVTVG